MPLSFKGARFDKDVILLAIRWYLCYSLSYRDLEEMFLERGLRVDHSTLNRWVLKYTPELEQAFRRKKKAVGGSWYMDETYIKVKGQWLYHYRAVDKAGQTIDFLLSSKRDEKAARRFLDKAIRTHGTPYQVTLDKSGANKAALESLIEKGNNPISLRQNKYLNNRIEQDHRFIKRRVRAMLGFKSFWSAWSTLTGIELMHMLRKKQLQTRENSVQARAE